MGFALPVIAIGQAVLGAVTMFAQKGAAEANAEAQFKAAARQAHASYKEITRQQEEVNRIAQEQVSDRVRAANQEMGALRVTAGERGASASTVVGLARTIAHLEGVDISRINKNRKSNIEAGEAAKEAARIGFVNTINLAQNQAEVEVLSAGLNFLGSGLQIAGGFVRDRAFLNSLD